MSVCHCFLKRQHVPAVQTKKKQTVFHTYRSKNSQNLASMLAGGSTVTQLTQHHASSSLFPPLGVISKLSLVELLSWEPQASCSLFLFFPPFSQTAGVPVLRWEGRAEATQAGKCRCLFPFCCACESDYRSLSQYLASADGIIAAEFIYSGPPPHLLQLTCAATRKAQRANSEVLLREAGLPERRARNHDLQRSSRAGLKTAVLRAVWGMP